MTSFQNISSEAKKIIEDREELWEYRLFSTLLNSSIENTQFEKLDVYYEMDGGRIIVIDDIWDLKEWAMDKLDVLRSICSSLEKSINDALSDAFIDDNENRQIGKLIYISEKIAQQYKRALKWKLDFNAIESIEDFKKVIRLISKLADEIIEEIERFAGQLKEQVDVIFQAIKTETKSKINKDIKIVMDITIPDTSRIQAELSKLESKHC